MKKYLISIEKEDSSRLADFFSQSTFGNYKSEFKKVGVIGAQLPTAEYFKLAVAGRKKPLSPAELGCTLSHVNALKDFLASNEKYACIFEDDAICTHDLDLNELENQIISMALKPCFFFSLGGIQLKSNYRVRGRYVKSYISGSKILEINRIYYGHFFYAYAYIVDREMALTLIKYHDEPQCYDSWSNLLHFNENANFFASFLFDHPEINNELLSKSYLEEERRMNIQKTTYKKTIFEKMKISFLKRFYKLILDKY